MSNPGLDTLLKIGVLDNYNCWILDQVKPFLGRKVFEAGSGIGNITKYLLSAEKVVSVDISDQNLAYLKDSFKKYPQVEILKHNLADPLPGRLKEYGFDSVVFLNVLEHIADERAALANLREIMGENTKLIILVPALPFLYSRMDKALDHFRRYSRKSLLVLLENAGFTVEKTAYFNWLGVIGYFLDFKVFKKTSFSVFQLEILDKFCWFFKLLDKLKMPFGLSLFVICRRTR